MSEAELNRIAELQEQLANLYSNLPIQPKTEFELIKERIHSGERFHQHKGALSLSRGVYSNDIQLDRARRLTTDCEDRRVS